MGRLQGAALSMVLSLFVPESYRRVPGAGMIGQLRNRERGEDCEWCLGDNQKAEGGTWLYTKLCRQEAGDVPTDVFKL